MRIITLLPAATEIVAALGAAAELVGISHECDYPARLDDVPRVTTTPIDPAGSSREIDTAVRRVHESGGTVIEVDARQIAALAPDLLITQGLCQVCAVHDGQLHCLADLPGPLPQTISLAGRTLAAVLDDIVAVGAVLGREREAAALVTGLRARLSARDAGAAGLAPRRVVCVEWLDPLYLAGHWVPDMIEAAGARDVGAAAGSHSVRRAWAEVAALEPEAVLVMLCGFDIPRSRAELAVLDDPAALGVLTSVPVWVMDGNAYTSRPGPRLVDGIELMRGALRNGREGHGIERWTPTRPD